MPWNDTARVEHRRDAVRYPSDLTGREWELIAPNRRAVVVHRINPAARQIDQRREVLELGHHLGLEPTHGTRGGCARLHRTSADNLTHHWIAAQAV